MVDLVESKSVAYVGESDRPESWGKAPGVLKGASS